MNTEPRSTCMPGILARAIVLVLILGTFSPALAERIGQVRAVDFEEQTIVIDNTQYRLGNNLVPRQGDTNRIADLRAIRPGMPVKYETASGQGTQRTVIRLILLAED